MAEKYTLRRLVSATGQIHGRSERTCCRNSKAHWDGVVGPVHGDARWSRRGQIEVHDVQGQRKVMRDSAGIGFDCVECVVSRGTSDSHVIETPLVVGVVL